MPVASRKKRRKGTAHPGRTTDGMHPVPKPVRKPASVDDLFGGGESGNLIHPDFDTKAVYAWFQKRHSKGRRLIDEDGYYRTGDHEWKVPYGVRAALRTPLVHGQMVVKYPFYATWVSPKTGKRMKKNFMSLISAVDFVATKAQYVDSDATVVAKVVGFHIPPKLRGKFPRRMNGQHLYWCPYCMSPRKFIRVNPVQEFYAIKKFWNEEKGRYQFKDVKLATIKCSVCGISNRDAKFRQDNQPYEVRRIKQGVRRVRKTKKRRAA